MCLLVCDRFGNRLDCGASKWEACQSDFENRLIGESNQSVLDLLIRLSWHAVCPGIEWVLWLITFLGTNCNVLSCDGIAEALPHPMSRQWFGLYAVLEVKCRPTFGFDTGHGCLENPTLHLPYPDLWNPLPQILKTPTLLSFAAQKLCHRVVF